MKIIKAAILIMAVVSMTACHVFDDWEAEEGVKIYFTDTNLTVMRGGLANFVLNIEPLDAYENLGVSYTLSNKEIGLIYRGDRRGVIITAAREGSCIVKANLGDVEARAVLTVTEKIDP